jgi:hypothetical protein
MIKDDLYELGFKDEIKNKPNGILIYHIIEEENNEVFLQICVKNTDIFLTLVVNQYDWNEMVANITYLPMINVIDISSLKTEIETLKRLFVI